MSINPLQSIPFPSPPQLPLLSPLIPLSSTPYNLTFPTHSIHVCMYVCMYARVALTTTFSSKELQGHENNMKIAKTHQQQSVGVHRVSVYERLKSSVFSLLLKIGNDGANCTSRGRSFHTFAAATGNARSPINLCLEAGTSSLAVDADRSRRLDSMSLTRRSSLDRYDGARPCWQRKARTARRYSIRCGTRNQWRSRNSGVM